MTKVIKCVEAHYEVQEVEMGTVYRWCPESIVIRCGCGERAALTASRTTCGECEVDHQAITKVVLDVRQEEDKVDHPWRSLRPYSTPTRGT
jgi:ribosomal protein S27AE